MHTFLLKVHNKAIEISVVRWLGMRQYTPSKGLLQATKAGCGSPGNNYEVYNFTINLVFYWMVGMVLEQGKNIIIYS